VNDLGWRRKEVDSPCVKLCVLHPVDRICLGCHRTIDEIAQWSRLSAEERRAVMKALPGRQPSQVRRGGRAARLAREG
jgi:predicted Fe-S protein YdhL (DUF1289 family)